MKTILTALAFAAASFAAQAQAQPATASVASTSAPTADAYTTMMTATIAELLQTKDAAAVQTVLDKLGRAAAAKPADWLPRYYLAYGAARQAYMSKDAELMDKTLDRAQADLDQARKLRGDESELQVLQAYIHQARIMVSPMMRGMKYTAKVQESLNAAEKANPANPRIYLLRGNDFYFRPAMFGGGAEAARPHFLKAKEAYAAFKPASELAPSWGERQALGLLKKIDEDAAKASAK
ncbi:hypothetical protein GCM10023185_16840 [Hymenobacter saemangeumensis]|uniref:Tetratricopeptide repeat protein n=1 Tax=Hymenobacter saemangeumensis TaxID=1084522 RepID=A0ABP8IAX3_9BACT